MSDETLFITQSEVARFLSNADLLKAIREERNEGIFDLGVLKREAEFRGLDPDGKDEPDPPLAATA